MQRASGGLLRTALALATLACVSSLYEDQVMPVPAPRRCVLYAPSRHACALGSANACSRPLTGVAAGPQVGVNDFHMANLGDLTTAQFHPDTQRKRIYFSTVSCRARARRALPARTLSAS